MPLFLVNRQYALGLAVGVGIANIFSPFGWYDWMLMPLATLAILMLSSVPALHARPNIALAVAALLSAAAVTFFPLYLGGGIPLWPTFALISLSQLIIYYLGWHIIWKHYGDLLS